MPIKLSMRIWEVMFDISSSSEKGKKPFDLFMKNTSHVSIYS